MNDTQPTAGQVPSGGEQTPAMTERFLLHLADRLGAKATVAVVYGEPIEREGVTIVPVARVRWGFGGGGGNGNIQAGPGISSGRTKRNSQPGLGSGLGGGANVSVIPVGYIEIANGMTEFRRISE
jgi:uncharacterized spore protein YtfJ